MKWLNDKNADANVVQVVDYVIERECELTQVKKTKLRKLGKDEFSSSGKKFPL